MVGEQSGCAATQCSAEERVSGVTSDVSDIWSWGITLAEVLSGKAAYAQGHVATCMVP